MIVVGSLRPALTLGDTTLSHHDRTQDLFSVGILSIPYTLLAYRFWWVCDDAFISFRFARNWANGHGIRYNLGDHVPVEGYSDFLWVAIAAGVEHLTGEPVLWMPVLSFLCGLCLLYRLLRALRHKLELPRGVAFLSVMVLGCFPPFAVWATGGLEVMPYCLALFLCFDLMVLGRRLYPVAGGIAALALSLLRFEGVAWAALIGFVAAVSRYTKGQRASKAIATYFLIAGTGAVVYFWWRYQYYEELFPNSVQAKAVLSWAALARGFRYVAGFMLTFLTPLWMLPGFVIALRHRWRSDGLAVSALVLASMMWAVIVGGDFMPMGRFLIPAVIFSVILLAWLLQQAWDHTRATRAVAVGLALALVGLGLLPGWNIHVVPTRVLAATHFRHKDLNRFRTEHEVWESTVQNSAEWKTLGLVLARHARAGESLVRAAIGNVGYYSDLFIYDRVGLVNPDVASRSWSGRLGVPGHDRVVPPTYFLLQQPTFLDAMYAPNPRAKRVMIERIDLWESWGVARWYAPVLFPARKTRGERVSGFVLGLRLVNDERDLTGQWRRVRQRVRALPSDRRIPNH